MGKTTVSINLAHAFAIAGVKTLLVDADPQGSVGLSLTRQSRLLPGFYDYLADPGLSLEQLIVPTRLETFSLMASGQAGDYDTGGSMGAHLARVRTFLHQISQRGFDLCLIDTAAGLFGVSGDVIASSDAVLIPQQAEPLGIRSVPKLLDGLGKLRVMNPRLQVLGVLLTMVQNDLDDSIEAAKALSARLERSVSASSTPTLQTEARPTEVARERERIEPVRAEPAATPRSRARVDDDLFEPDADGARFRAILGGRR